MLYIYIIYVPGQAPVCVGWGGVEKGLHMLYGE